MTRQSLSWIDPQRWDVLLGGAIGAPSRRRAPWSEVTMPSTSAITVRPRRNSHVASLAVPVAPPKKLDSWRPPAGGLEDRFRGLMQWIVATIPCHSAFIADDNGLPVIEHAAADAGHIATTSSVLLLLVSIRNMMGDTSGGWVSLQMGTGVLHFVEIETPLGRFGVGIFTNDSLSADVLGPLRRAVERAFATVELRNEG